MTIYSFKERDNKNNPPVASCFSGGARGSRTLRANMAMVTADRLHSPLFHRQDYITKFDIQKGLPCGSPVSSADGNCSYHRHVKLVYQITMVLSSGLSTTLSFPSRILRGVCGLVIPDLIRNLTLSYFLKASSQGVVTNSPKGRGERSAVHYATLPG